MVPALSLQDSVSKQGFKRACDYSWRDLFFAHKLPGDQHTVSPDELQNELEECQARRASKMHGLDPVALDLSAPDTTNQFFSVMSELEQKQALEYEARYPGQAFSVMQNPDARATMSRPWSLQTLISNMHLLWTFAVKPARWLSSTESLFGF